MWLWMALGSALLLGFYDVAKKQAVSRNSVLFVLFVATAVSTLFVSPALLLYHGSAADHIGLMVKAIVVSTSWISGLIALKLLPLTTVSALKALRPFIVVVASILLFGEHLNLWQWGGVFFALLAMALLSGVSNREGISFSSHKGVIAMAVSILTGAASALYDKHILTHLDSLFVQSWTNLYITIVIGILILLRREKEQKFSWDWTLVLIALLITASDALYFFAIKQEGSLLSLISLARRCSVLVTFAIGAIFFKEEKVLSKALALGILVAGMVMLLIGTN